MPDIIKILPDIIANKIAAGEVVQRPESVVKELVENSIDAGAKNISVFIKDSGKSLIQIVDDGCGMSEQDASTAFHRHATSKIYSYEDLESIGTLGFRGEALASISSVAQVEMRTKQRGDALGTLVRVDGGEGIEVAKVAMSDGTSVSVRNLFYNTPARRNFLKSNDTEFRHIFDVVRRFALSNPNFSILFASEDEEIFNLKPLDLQMRVEELFGEKVFTTLIWLHEQTETISVEGCVGKPTAARKSRGDQFLFLNGRYIVNRAIQHAVFSAYEHLINKGDYPFFLLFLTVDPRRVDVNVHPSKLEVKFDDERNVYRFVGAAVRRALSRNDLAPSVSIQEKPDGQGRGNGFSNFELTETGKRPNLDRGPDIGYQPDAAHAQVSQATKPVSTHGFDLERDRIVGQEGQLPSVEGEAVQNVPGGLGVDDQGQRELYHDNQRVPIPEGKGIWQLHGRYILSQIRTGLMIVDQHVAHERILYEKALTSLNTNLPFSQQLLFPHTAELAACDIALVKELLPHLEKLGFDMKLFGKNTVVIEGVPPDVRVGDEHTILEEVISQYKELNKQESGTMDNLAKSFACKAAIKAGQRLSINEMVSLIDQLFATSMPYVCPHGRPVVIKIPIEEFDKRFGR